MKEKWVQINKIQGFEEVKDCYWISNSDEDKIMNKDTGKMIKLYVNRDGYLIINLWTVDRKKKTCKIHVLKTRAFIYTPNPLTYNIIRHLNDDKYDNRLENLAWGSQSNNIRDCVRNGNYSYSNGAKTGAKNGKKRSKPVRCLETGMIYSSTREAGRKLGISNASISLCCSGKNKTAKGFHWEYID